VASMGDMGAVIGMLIVETIAKIRRAYFVQQKPIKAICRELGLSRKVVRKVLRSEATGHRFLVGDGATIADICCYSDVAFAQLSNKDLAAWPNVIAWAERIEGLPGFAKPFDILAMQDAEFAF
jgi:glutathione S-transferase